MNVEEVLAELKAYGNENTKKILTKHGAREPFRGVKVVDLKRTLTKIKGDQGLALYFRKSKTGLSLILSASIFIGNSAIFI